MCTNLIDINRAARVIMDGQFNRGSPIYDPEDSEISSPRSPGDLKPTHHLSPPSCFSPKRSRRSVQKRVVTIPIAEADSTRPKIAGEGAPPSDSWAWRKYGQKPIKGSPYPRGYYRCSSSKGCPARKQVERSRTDPTTLVVTYAADHNHPWPLPKNHNHLRSAAAAAPAEEPEAPPARFAPPEPAEPDDKFADLVTGEDYCWFLDVGSPTTSTDDFLLGSIFVSADVAAMTFSDEFDDLTRVGTEDVDDALFAGLGELPECSVVLRRGFLDSRRRCGITASR